MRRDHFTMQLDTVLNSLSPPQRGEGWGEGIFTEKQNLLTPALSSFWEEREKTKAVARCTHERILITHESWRTF
jgi:hypothetical protein